MPCESATQVSPELAPSFASYCAIEIGQCKKLAKLANFAATYGADPDDAVLQRLLKKLANGKGRGRIKLPFFSGDVDRQIKSSSLAVAIANVSCPTAGSATVAAIAIATVAQSDRGAASSAIAGVLTAGVDVTSVFQQVAVMTRGAQRNAAISAFAAAVVASDPASASLLLAYIADALNNIGANAGCDTVADALSLLAAATADGAPTSLAAITPSQMSQLCGWVGACAGACGAVGVMG